MHRNAEHDTFFTGKKKTKEMTVVVISGRELGCIIIKVARKHPIETVTFEKRSIGEERMNIANIRKKIIVGIANKMTLKHD
jgi:hypothetical protein